MTIGLVTAQPWPEHCFAIELDALGEVSLADMAALERRSVPSIGVVQGRCEGAALAVAIAVDFVVAGPDASFGNAGEWTDVVIRRGSGIVGRKAVGFLTMTGRSIGATLALQWGLVSAVDPQPVRAATDLVGLITSRSEVAVATVLKQAHRGASSDYAMSGVAGGPPRAGNEGLTEE